MSGRADLTGPHGADYNPVVPEILEVESYRALAESALHRQVAAVEHTDAALLRGGIAPRHLAEVLCGATFVAARRKGKLLLLDGDAGFTLGVHFGMTGLLEVDGRLTIERLEYASPKLDPAWVRMSIRFVDGGRLALHDQRRFGAIDLDPDEDALGPDAFAITHGQLRHALGTSRAPLKARLLDQRRVAGLGNLLVDELLWRASLAPTPAAGGLDGAETARLHRHLRRTLAELAVRGGSHRGDLQAARVPGSTCPRDGAKLRREVVGGRTTYWCPDHQRGAAGR